MPFTVSQSLLRFMSIESMMLSHPLSPSSLSALNLSRVFSNESALQIRWPKYWSFSFSISPSSEYSGLISFRRDKYFLLCLFVGKVMSLLFIMLSSFVIAFLPRSKHLLISWLQSPSAIILEPKKIVCHCFPFYLP